MSDLELLFLVLGVIYLWECAWWARRGTVGFRTWFGRTWQIALPLPWLGNQTGGVVFSHPLPPLGYLLTSQGMPLSVSPEAVLAYQSPSIDAARRWQHTGKFIAFEEIQQIEAKGKRVLINGELFISAGSTHGAAQLAAALKKWREAARDTRGGLIEHAIDAMFDVKMAQARWRELQQQTRGLRFTANLLFFYLFALAPVALWRFGLNPTWIWLLAGMLGCTVSIALHFHRVHRRLYPEAEDERFTHCLIVLLSPASAVRALDLLSRPYLEPMHPLAVAKALCPERTVGNLAQEFLRELRYPALPLSPRPEPLAQATERYARELLLTRIEKFIRRNGWSTEELLRPPEIVDPGSVCFCPRCHAPFNQTAGACQDCGGIPLIPFKDKTRGATRGGKRFAG